MTVYIVIEHGLLWRRNAGVFEKEVDALRFAHEYPLPEGVMRRSVEPALVMTGLPERPALTPAEETP